MALPKEALNALALFVLGLSSWHSDNACRCINDFLLASTNKASLCISGLYSKLPNYRFYRQIKARCTPCPGAATSLGTLNAKVNKRYPLIIVLPLLTLDF